MTKVHLSFGINAKQITPVKKKIRLTPDHRIHNNVVGAKTGYATAHAHQKLTLVSQSGLNNSHAIIFTTGQDLYLPYG